MRPRGCAPGAREAWPRALACPCARLSRHSRDACGWACNRSRVALECRGMRSTLDGPPADGPPEAPVPGGVQALAALLGGHRIVAITGAGCSTESGIPDYRGPGTRERARNPIQHREF